MSKSIFVLKVSHGGCKRLWASIKDMTTTKARLNEESKQDLND